MAKKNGPKRDFVEIAFAVAQQAVGSLPTDILEETPAVKRARQAGLKGGVARAKSLTKDQRTEIARIAAIARWKKSPG